MKIRFKAADDSLNKQSAEEYDVLFLYSSDIRDSRAIIFGYNNNGYISLASLYEVEVTDANFEPNWKVKFLKKEDPEFPNFILRIGTATTLMEGSLYKLIEGSQEERLSIASQILKESEN